MACPLCGSRSVGKVGMEQFYCWDCFIEYRMPEEGKEIKIYSVCEDGSLEEYRQQTVVG